MGASRRWSFQNFPICEDGRIKHLNDSGSAAFLSPDRLNGFRMKLLGNILLSLVLLVLPQPFSASGATGSTNPASMAAKSCCRPAPKVCCQASCCVQSPARPGASLPTEAPSNSAASLFSPAALLHALWRLPAPPDRDLPARAPDISGAIASGVPLFLRHAALLI